MTEPSDEILEAIRRGEYTLQPCLRDSKRLVYPASCDECRAAGRCLAQLPMTDTQADLTERARAISAMDWRVLLSSLIHFGRSADGAVERDLWIAIERAIQSAREAAAAEARRAAIEECAQIANRVRRRAAENAEHISGRMGLGIDQLRRLDASLAGQRHAAHEIEDKLRTLASPAPQEETR